MLPENANPKKECYDDKDRDGKFSYDAGDRAFDLNGWRYLQEVLYRDDI